MSEDDPFKHCDEVMCTPPRIFRTSEECHRILDRKEASDQRISRQKRQSWFEQQRLASENIGSALDHEFSAIADNDVESLVRT
ncbi:MAG: hypothetical protein QM673_07720, partial [Gordonia sp. (in: high G+C Gram-positive bacteria)]